MYKLTPKVVMTQTETGVVLLDQRTGRYWAMNDTGALVLRHLLAGGAVDAAVHELCRDYAHVDPVRAARDTRLLIEQLRSSGLVTA